MRGEFILPSGLVVPNNVSLAGAEQVLRAAFRDEVLTLYAGLFQGTPTINMTSADLTEPTIGVNGYARIAVPQTALGWPTVAVSNNEKYVETDWLEWTAVGGDFDQAIQRVGLLATNTYTITDDIFALSELLPAEIIIGTATAQADRRFKYRFYL